MVSIRASRRHGKSLAWLDRTLAVIFVILFFEFWWKDHIGTPAGFDDYSLLQQRVCAPQKGIIVVNFLDFLGYNLLQIGMARRLANELCWDVVTYRSMWKPGFGSKEEECFPNAILPLKQLSTLDAELIKDIGLDDGLWGALNDHPTVLDEAYEFKNVKVKKWSKQLEDEGKAWRCITPYCNYSEDAMHQTIATIRSPESKIRVIYLEAFFVHYEWMEAWRSHFRNWFAVKKQSTSDISSTPCCSQIPPADAVVVHVHIKGEERDDRLEDLKLEPQDYEKLVNKYHKKRKSVWIVCNEETSKTQYVSDLTIQLGAKVVVPWTPSDTLCILSKAQVGLFVTPSHILSMVGGILSNAEQVHYPTPNKITQFGLNVTDWKYHIVENDKLKYWNSQHKNLNFRSPWEP